MPVCSLHDRVNLLSKMVGAEGIEPSTSSASRKHSSTELRA